MSRVDDDDDDDDDDDGGGKPEALANLESFNKKNTHQVVITREVTIAQTANPKCSFARQDTYQAVFELLWCSIYLPTFTIKIRSNKWS